MGFTIKVLGPGDAAVLDRVAADVFDEPVQAELADEFLNDARHHLAVALDDHQVVVGMASAVHYVHPDKPAQLFINEVGVAPEQQRRGIASRLVSELLLVGSRLGCTEAWVATEPGNAGARGLYERLGGQPNPEPFVMYTFSLRER
jgi:aminoglycoside 6'-N-acetyltransferase I